MVHVEVLVFIASLLLLPVLPLEIEEEELVDGFIKAIKMDIMRKDLDRLRIPDLVKGFSKKVMMVTWQGSFKATDGWIQHISELEKIGNSTVDFFDGGALATVRLGFENLELEYGNYTVQFMKVGMRGNITAIVGRVVMYMELTLAKKGKLLIGQLEKLDIEDISDIKVDISGSSSLNWIATQITGWVVIAVKEQIIVEVEKTLGDTITQMIDQLETSGSLFV